MSLTCGLSRFCAVADEINGKIYMLGGVKSHAYWNAYQYTIANNAWSPMQDSSLHHHSFVTFVVFVL